MLKKSAPEREKNLSFLPYCEAVVATKGVSERYRYTFASSCCTNQSACGDVQRRRRNVLETDTLLQSK